MVSPEQNPAPHETNIQRLMREAKERRSALTAVPSSAQTPIAPIGTPEPVASAAAPPGSEVPPITPEDVFAPDSTETELPKAGTEPLVWEESDLADQASIPSAAEPLIPVSEKKDSWYRRVLGRGKKEGQAKDESDAVRVGVEVIPRTKLIFGGRHVRLKFNGEDTGMTWGQPMGWDKKPEDGKFYLVDIENTEGALKIPSGTRLRINDLADTYEVMITGGENIKININDLRIFMDSKGFIFLETKDSSRWKEGSSHYEGEPGKSRFFNRKATDQQKRLIANLSVGDAIALLKEKLAETAQPLPAPESKTKEEAEAEETAFLTALAGEEFQGEEKKAELEAEIKKFRDNLKELEYGYNRNKAWEAKVLDKKPFLTFHDEEGDEIVYNELATVFKLGYGYDSLKGANGFLEHEVGKSKTTRAEEKANRKEALAKFESFCKELEYGYKIATGTSSKLPIIMLYDKSGECVTKHELGDEFGYVTLADVNDFLEKEPKDPVERASRKAKEKVKLEEGKKELEANCATLKYSYEIKAGSSGRLLIVILDGNGKQISLGKDGSEYEHFSYAGAIEFVKERIAKITASTPVSTKVAQTVGFNTEKPLEAAPAPASTGGKQEALAADQERELTAVEKAQAEYDAAKNEWEKKGFDPYREALDKYPAYISAKKLADEAWRTYQEALKNSKLEKSVFDETPDGKKLLSVWGGFFDLEFVVEDAFNNTPKGKKLFDEQERLLKVISKAEEALLNQAKAAAPAVTKAGGTPD